MNKKLAGLVCLAMLVAGLEVNAKDPWKHIVFNCPARIAIDFTTQGIIRGLMATNVWANVTDPTLGSDSRVEIEIEMAESARDLPRPFRTLRLWYNPFDQHYTIQTPDFEILSEGKTGTELDPVYFMTVRVIPRDGAPYLLTTRTLLDFRGAL